MKYELYSYLVAMESGSSDSSDEYWFLEVEPPSNGALCSKLYSSSFVLISSVDLTSFFHSFSLHNNDLSLKLINKAVFRDCRLDYDYLN